MRRSFSCWSVRRLSRLVSLSLQRTRAVPAAQLYTRSRRQVRLDVRCIATPLVTSTRACAATAQKSSPYEVTNDDDDDDFMQAYEDLLLNVSAQTENGTLAPAGGGVGVERGAASPDNTLAEEAWGSSSVLSNAASAVDLLVDDAVALLPADGSPLQLTDVTPALDLEAVSEHFGSARRFFELYPHIFTCAQDGATRRWWVARAPRAAVAAPASSARRHDGSEDEKARHAALDVGEMSLREELTQLGVQQANPTHTTVTAAAAASVAHHGEGARRRGVVRVDPSASVLHASWPVIATLLPDDGRPLPIAQLRALLPPELKQQLHEANTGLARCFKLDYAAAHACVRLSADSTAMMRADAQTAAAPPAEEWAPPPASLVNPALQQHCENTLSEGDAEGVYVPVPRDYVNPSAETEAEAWWVAVPFEDEDVVDAREGSGGGAGATNTNDVLLNEDDEAGLVSGAGVADGATGLEEVPYEGISNTRSSGDTVGDASLLRGLDVALLRCAPALPTAKKPQEELPTSLAGGSSTSTAPGKKKAARVPRPTTPEEWIALHTALANAHGWLTPPQMLDYLVECVPTFFVPYDEVRTSDALVKLIGPRINMQTLLRRIYMYYTDRAEDGTQVRLAEAVQHAQRGIANVHYPQWDPSTQQRQPTDEGWGADGGDEVGAAPPSATAAATRSTTTGLQASEATKAFPVLRVLRPIRSALSSQLPRRRNAAGMVPPPVGAPTKLKHASAAMASLDKANTAAVSGTASNTSTTASSSAARPLEMVVRGGGVSLATIPTTDIGYPFMALATQPAAEWPWWARLLCVLPYSRYVPLDAVAALCHVSLTPSETEQVWSAGASIADAEKGNKARTAHPFPYTLLRTPPDSARQVRLRPFWLSPGCTAELDAAVLPGAVVKLLRPVWVPVPRLLQRLSADTRDETLAMATRRMPGVAISAEDAFVCLLRDCGRCCWVNAEGTKVRRYTSTQEMDDIFHPALSLLYGFASPRTWEPVSTILDRAAAHVQPLLADSASAVRDVGLIGMLRHTPAAQLQTWLQRHVQWIDLKTTGQGDGGVPELLVRRRASFVSFGGDTK